MSNSLSTYIADHLAGSVHAIELIEHLRDEHGGDSLGQFAALLLVEVEADKQVLQTLAERVGTGSSGFKEMTAWLSEKFGRLKLSEGSGNGLGTFEALEFLALGIHGKSALWRALAAVAALDARLQSLDYQHLIERAETQYLKVEERRLEAARRVLLPSPS